MAGDKDAGSFDRDSPKGDDDSDDDRLLSLLTGPDASGTYYDTNLTQESGPSPLSHEILPGSDLLDSSSDEPVSPKAPSSYSQARQEAGFAAGLAERAKTRHKSSLQALARLPYPWVRPAIRLLLWSLAAAFSVFLTDLEQEPSMQEVSRVFSGAGLMLLAGEAAGLTLKAAFRKSGIPGRLFQFLNMGFLAIFLIATLFQSPLHEAMTQSAVWLFVALFVAAAMFLPMLGGDVAQFKALQRKAQITAGRHAEARNRATIAYKNLAAIHRANLNALPAQKQVAPDYWKKG